MPRPRLVTIAVRHESAPIMKSEVRIGWPYARHLCAAKSARFAEIRPNSTFICAAWRVARGALFVANIFHVELDLDLYHLHALRGQMSAMGDFSLCTRSLTLVNVYDRRHLEM